MNWLIWLLLIILAVGVFFAARHETIHDNKRRGFIVYNDLFGHPAYDGRIFWTLRGATKACLKMSRQVTWCTYSVRKVL